MSLRLHLPIASRLNMSVDPIKFSHRVENNALSAAVPSGKQIHCHAQSSSAALVHLWPVPVRGNRKLLRFVSI